MANRKKPNEIGTSQDASLVEKQAEGKPSTDAPVPSVAEPVVSDPGTQYVAGDSRYPWWRGDLILTGSVDEAETLNGWKLWDEIFCDSTAQGMRLWIKVNTLVDGFTIEPRKIEPDSPDDEPLASDMAEANWCRRYCQHISDRLAKVDRNINATIWNLLDGAMYPHKLAEVTYDTLKSGPFVGNPGFKCIRSKPRDVYELVYDEMHTFRGVIAKVPGGNQTLLSGILPDASKFGGCIAAEKILLFYVTDEDGEPRSLWNGVYAPWARLQSIYMELMDAAEAMAGAKVSTELSDESRGLEFKNEKTGANETLMDQTIRNIRRWRNNGAFIGQAGSNTTVWYPPSGVLDGFLKSIKQFQREMVMALTIDSKAIIEGEQSSGLSEDKSDETASPVISLIQQRLCWLLEKLFYNAVKLARGEEYADKYAPTVAMGKAESADFTDAGATGAQMFMAKMVFPSQLNAVADKMGLNRPTADELAAYTTMFDAWMEQSKNPPTPAAGVTAAVKPAPKPPAKKK